jgi:hypothetical protein
MRCRFTKVATARAEINLRGRWRVCHSLPGAFQVQVARGLTGKPRMGMGSTFITPAYITAAAGGLGKLAQDLLSPAAAPRIEPQRLRTSAGPRQMK